MFVFDCPAGGLKLSRSSFDRRQSGEETLTADTQFTPNTTGLGEK